MLDEPPEFKGLLDGGRTGPPVASCIVRKREVSFIIRLTDFACCDWSISGP